MLIKRDVQPELLCVPLQPFLVLPSPFSSCRYLWGFLRSQFGEALPKPRANQGFRGSCSPTSRNGDVAGNALFCKQKSALNWENWGLGGGERVLLCCSTGGFDASSSPLGFSVLAQLFFSGQMGEKRDFLLLLWGVGNGSRW